MCNITKSCSYFFSECVNTYKVHNQKLPDWIVIYRDGMGDSEGPQAGGSEITEIEVSFRTLLIDF